MLLLVIGASWLFVLSLVLGLCVSARDGDLQQDLSKSAASRQPVSPGRWPAGSTPYRQAILSMGVSADRHESTVSPTRTYGTPLAMPCDGCP